MIRFRSTKPAAFSTHVLYGRLWVVVSERQIAPRKFICRAVPVDALTRGAYA